MKVAGGGGVGGAFRGMWGTKVGGEVKKVGADGGVVKRAKMSSF